MQWARNRIQNEKFTLESKNEQINTFDTTM